MVHMRPERYSNSVYKKFNSKSAGPYKNLKKISFNAYVVDSPDDMV